MARSVVYIPQFGNNLRNLRTARGLTRAALASLAGVDRTRIYELEGADISNPTLDTLLRLQRALELSSLELLLDGITDFASVRLRTELNADETEREAG